MSDYDAFEPIMRRVRVAGAPDISAIPSIALRQVAVLDDGAAAQYGSDGIAGVMNFQLKDAPSRGLVEPAAVP